MSLYEQIMNEKNEINQTLINYKSLIGNINDVENTENNEKISEFYEYIMNKKTIMLKHITELTSYGIENRNLEQFKEYTKDNLLYNILQYNKIYTDELLNLIFNTNKISPQIPKEHVESFKKNNIEILKGAAFSDQKYAYIKNNRQYVFELENNEIKNCIARIEKFTDNNNINLIHDYLLNTYPELGDLWILISGNKNYETIFIGNNTGYLGILYSPLSESLFEPNFQKNEKYFQNQEFLQQLENNNIEYRNITINNNKKVKL